MPGLNQSETYQRSPCKELVGTSDRLRSGNSLLLDRWLALHRRLKLQTLKVARYGYEGKRPPILLIGNCALACVKAPIDFNRVPLLSVSDIVDHHIIVLAPEERDGIELLPGTENVLCCC